MMLNRVDSTLDTEWVKLMREARNIGMTPQQVRQFLREKRKSKTVYVTNKVSSD